MKARDPEAWKGLVDLYAPSLYCWCRRAGLQAEDARDVVQEVFRALATHIGRFRRDRPGDSFRKWLSTITANKIRDHWRSQQAGPRAEGGTDAQRRLTELPDRPPQLSQDEEDLPGEADWAHRAVELVRAGVEDRTWQAFWRMTVDGQKAADVAEELGMTVHAVYDAKYRVRRRIQQELDGLIE